MNSMDLMSHIASALVFGGLLYWVFNLKKKRDFLLYLLSLARGGKGKVMVDWPANFLKRFAEAFALPIEGHLDFATKPTRIYPESLVKLFFSHGITSISIKGQKTASSKPIVEFQLGEQASNASAISQEMQKGLG